MSKLKVKKEVVKQLKLLIRDYPEYASITNLLCKHSKLINSDGLESWEFERYPLLNELSFSEMYDLLHDNYEIEMDAEDEIRNRYYYEQNRLSKLSDLNFEWYKISGYLDGIEFVLRKLNKEYIIEQFTKKVGE